MTDKLILQVTRDCWDRKEGRPVQRSFEIVFDPRKLPSRLFSDVISGPSGKLSRVYGTIVIREKEQP